eukprot:SAG31_NODE_8647_length_1414_cov_1.553612_1_plen_184_part_01
MKLPLISVNNIALCDFRNTPPGVDGIPPGERQCRYYSKGEALLEADRVLWNTAEAVDGFHAIWRNENFGLSYDVDKVTAYNRELTVQTKSAAVDLGPAAASAEKVALTSALTVPLAIVDSGLLAAQVYRGTAQFHLVRTIGVDGQIVDTWTNSATSEDGTPDFAQNQCCTIGLGVGDGGSPSGS